jgi:hypothetical protein
MKWITTLLLSATMARRVRRRNITDVEKTDLSL